MVNTLQRKAVEMNLQSFLNRISPLWILLLFAAVPLSHAAELSLVKDGAPQAVIVAASDAQGAARRLADLVSHETSATLAIIAPTTPVSKDKLEIVLCSPATRKEMVNRLTPALRTMDLPSEGFVIDIQATPNQGRILLMGTRNSAASPRWTDPAGLRYAAGELWNYRLRLSGKTLTAPAALHVEDKPAFPKRIFWNWDFMTNWDDSLKKVHQTSSIDPGGSLTPCPEPARWLLSAILPRDRLCIRSQAQRLDHLGISE